MNKPTGFYPFLAVVLLSLLMSSGVCFAGPGLLNYQGRLTDGKGNPVTYTVTITFTFWSAESGGEMLGGFLDSDTVTPDKDGIYSTLVGDDPGNLIPESVFERKGVWLNVNVNGEDLRPRKRLTSVGYSVQSETVQGAEVGRMSFRAGDHIKAGEVVILNTQGEIVPTKLPGVGDAFQLAPADPLCLPTHAVQVSAGKTLVFYYTASGGRAVVANVTDLSVTADLTKEATLPNSAFEVSDAGKLDENKAIVTYTVEWQCRAVVASVSPDGSIVFGNPSLPIASGDPLGAGNAPWSALTVLDSSRVLIAYNEGTATKAAVVTVSGTNITTSTVVQLASDDPGMERYYYGCVELEPNKVLISYYASSILRAIVVTVSGTSISPGPSLTIPSEDLPGGASWSDLTPLAPNRGLLAYAGAPSRTGTCCVWVLSSEGSTLSRSSPFQVCSYDGTLIGHAFGLVRVSDNLCLVVNLAKAYPLNGSDSTISLGTPILYTDNSRIQNYFACASVSSSRALIAYKEIDSVTRNRYGTFIRVIDTELAKGGWGFENRIGVAENTVEAGEDCMVTIPGGVTKQFSGLTPGKDYYVTENGISDQGVLRIGIALTPNKLLISR